MLSIARRYASPSSSLESNPRWRAHLDRSRERGVVHSRAYAAAAAFAGDSRRWRERRHSRSRQRSRQRVQKTNHSLSQTRRRGERRKRSASRSRRRSGRRRRRRSASRTRRGSELRTSSSCNRKRSARARPGTERRRSSSRTRVRCRPRSNSTRSGSRASRDCYRRRRRFGKGARSASSSRKRRQTSALPLRPYKCDDLPVRVDTIGSGPGNTRRSDLCHERRSLSSARPQISEQQCEDGVLNNSSHVTLKRCASGAVCMGSSDQDANGSARSSSRNSDVGNEGSSSSAARTQIAEQHSENGVLSNSTAVTIERCASGSGCPGISNQDRLFENEHGELCCKVCLQCMIESRHSVAPNIIARGTVESVSAIQTDAYSRAFPVQWPNIDFNGDATVNILEIPSQAEQTVGLTAEQIWERLGGPDAMTLSIGQICEQLCRSTPSTNQVARDIGHRFVVPCADATNDKVCLERSAAGQWTVGMPGTHGSITRFTGTPLANTHAGESTRADMLWIPEASEAEALVTFTPQLSPNGVVVNFVSATTPEMINVATSACGFYRGVFPTSHTEFSKARFVRDSPCLSLSCDGVAWCISRHQGGTVTEAVLRVPPPDSERSWGDGVNLLAECGNRVLSMFPWAPPIKKVTQLTVWRCPTCGSDFKQWDNYEHRHLGPGLCQHMQDRSRPCSGMPTSGGKRLYARTVERSTLHISRKALPVRAVAAARTIPTQGKFGGLRGWVFNETKARIMMPTLPLHLGLKRVPHSGTGADAVGLWQAHVGVRGDPPANSDGDTVGDLSICPGCGQPTNSSMPTDGCAGIRWTPRLEDALCDGLPDVLTSWQVIDLPDEYLVGNASAPTPSASSSSKATRGSEAASEAFLGPSLQGAAAIALCCHRRGGADVAEFTVTGRPLAMLSSILCERPALLQAARVAARSCSQPCQPMELSWHVRQPTVCDELTFSAENFAEPRDFRLLDNSLDPLATDPASFLLPLRPEQRRTLGWMLHRENSCAPPVSLEVRSTAGCVSYGDSLEGRRGLISASTWALEARITLNLPIRGGILGDEIGYGKTVCAIALSAAAPRTLPIVAQSQDMSGPTPTKATLIVAPTNLVGQWKAEIHKFLGDTVSVVVLPTCAQLKSCTVAKIADADFVIANYRLFYSKIYMEQLASSAGIEEKLPQPQVKKGKFTNGPTWEKLYANTISALRLRPRDIAKLASEKFPVLESFYWHRVVLDEFHELLVNEQYWPAKVAVQGLLSSRIWGLSGTLPRSSLSEVATVASFFDVPLEEVCKGSEMNAAVGVAQNVLDVLARKSRVEGVELQKVDKVTLVSQTGPERLLYLGRLGAATDSEGELAKAEELLRLCSHFSLGGAAAAAESPDSECDRVLAAHRRKLQQSRKSLETAVDMLVVGVVELLADAAKRATAAEHAAAAWADAIEFEKGAIDADVAANVTVETLLAEKEQAAKTVQQKDFALVTAQQESTMAVANLLSAREIAAAASAELESAQKKLAKAKENCAGVTASMEATEIASMAKEDLRGLRTNGIADTGSEKPASASTQTVNSGSGPRVTPLTAASSGRAVKTHQATPSNDVANLESFLLAGEATAEHDWANLLAAQDVAETVADEAARMVELISEQVIEADNHADQLATLVCASERHVSDVSNDQKMSFETLQTVLKELEASTEVAHEAKKERLRVKRVVEECESSARLSENACNSSLERLSDWRKFIDSLGLDPAPGGSAAVCIQAGAQAELQDKDHAAVVTRWLNELLCAARPVAVGTVCHDLAMRIAEVNSQRQNVRAQRAATMFFEEMLKQSQTDSCECSVCLDDVPVCSRCILPCAHVFCAGCAKAVADSHCPLCRAPVRREDGGVMHVAEPGKWNSTLSQADRRRWGHYGSKLVAVARAITDILEADISSAIIVFVQWSDLQNKISRAFKEFGIAFAVLGGAAACRSNIISRFQAGEGPRVMLLNLEESASGTNLTRASHVMLVHPMYAPNSKVASDYEAQAIGRALRPGQQRTVTVHRFVTQSTVEQKLTETHQADIWAQRPGNSLINLEEAAGDSAAANGES